MLSTFKDKISKVLYSYLVFKFKSNIYNDIYYGKTMGHFKVRACEHLGITPLVETKVESPKEMAIFDHLLKTGHNPSSDDVEIFVKEYNEFRLLFRESLLISRDEPSLNKYVKLITLQLFT